MALPQPSAFEIEGVKNPLPANFTSPLKQKFEQRAQTPKKSPTTKDIENDVNRHVEKSHHVQEQKKEKAHEHTTHVQDVHNKLGRGTPVKEYLKDLE